MDSPLNILIGMLVPSAYDGSAVVWAKRILLATIIFGCFWLLGQLATFLVNKLGTRITKATSSTLDDRLIKRLSPSLSLLLTFSGVYYAFKTLPLHEKLFKFLANGMFIAIVVIICVVLYRAIDEFFKWYVDTLQDQESGRISLQMIPVLQKVAMIFIIAAALMVVLKHFNYDILSLVTALGIGSLAIGMAAKDTLAHMISGFTLMLDRPFRIGDRIQLANGQMGDVLDIGLRSTRIRTIDNTLLVIPNSDLCNTMLINQTFPDRKSRGKVSIGIAYGSDVESVKQLMVDIASNTEQVLTEPAPEAFLNAFGDSALQMQLFFWVDDYTKVASVTDRINLQILEQFKAKGIEIPFPTRTVLMQQS